MIAKLGLFILFCLPLQWGLAQQSLPDPTRPLVSSSAVSVNKTPLVLQAIYDRNSSKTAVINGKTVKPGDRLGAAKIISIFRSSVSIEQNGKRSMLSLRPTIR